MSHSIYFSINGVSISVESERKAFCDFLKQNYLPFFAEHPIAEPHIVIQLKETTHAVVPEEMFFRGATVFGKYQNNAYLRINQINTGITMRYTGNVLQVEGRIHRRLLRSFDDITLFYLTRYLFTYPFFMYSEFARNVIFLNALGIKRSEKGFLFFGLGKTFLMLKIAEKKFGELLSDNFALLKDDIILGFPELVRIEEGNPFVPRERFTPTSYKVYNKRLYKAKDACASSAPLSKAFIMWRGQDNKKTKISCDEFMTRLKDLDGATKECFEYAIFRNIARELGLAHAGIDRAALTEKALRGKETYLVQVKEGVFDEGFFKELLC